MPYLLRSLIAVLAASAALCHAENLQITPQQRQQGLSTAMQVDAQGTLNFELQGQHWQVQGWPADLPRQLGAQQVQSLFAQHPAGPVQALRLSEPRQSKPWLEVVKNGRNRRSATESGMPGPRSSTSIAGRPTSSKYTCTVTRAGSPGMRP